MFICFLIIGITYGIVYLVLSELDRQDRWSNIVYYLGLLIIVTTSMIGNYIVEYNTEKNCAKQILLNKPLKWEAYYHTNPDGTVEIKYKNTNGK